MDFKFHPSKLPPHLPLPPSSLPDSGSNHVFTNLSDWRPAFGGWIAGLGRPIFLSLPGPLPPVSTELTAVTPYDVKTARIPLGGKELNCRFYKLERTRYRFPTLCPRHVDAWKLILSKKSKLVLQYFCLQVWSCNNALSWEQFVGE